MKILLSLSFLFLATVPALGQATYEVIVGRNGANTFSPENITVRVGDTVRWVWYSGRHNVHATQDAFDSGSPTLAPFTFEVVFDAAFVAANPPVNSVYDYQCDPHSWTMTGKVKIAPEPQPTLVVSPMLVGQVCQLEMTPGAPGGLGWFVYSLSGPGELLTPYGFTLGLSSTVEILGSRPVDSVTGVATFHATIPTQASGISVSVQAIEQTTLGHFSATNVVTTVIQ